MKERNAIMAEFVKWRALGIAVCGRIVASGNNKNGDFIELSPVLYRTDDKAPWQRFDRLAVGLTTHLQRQIRKDELGVFVFIRYDDTRPSPSGSPQKLFKVFDVTKEEAADFAKHAKAANGPLNPPPVAGGSSAQYEHDDDDLPF